MVAAAGTDEGAKPVGMTFIGIGEFAPGDGDVGGLAGDVEVAVAAVPDVEVIEPDVMGIADGNGIVRAGMGPDAMDVEVAEDDVADGIDLKAAMNGGVFICADDGFVAGDFHAVAALGLDGAGDHDDAGVWVLGGLTELGEGGDGDGAGFAAACGGAVDGSEADDFC